MQAYAKAISFYFPVFFFEDKQSFMSNGKAELIAIEVALACSCKRSFQ